MVTIAGRYLPLIAYDEPDTVDEFMKQLLDNERLYHQLDPTTRDLSIQSDDPQARWAVFVVRFAYLINEGAIESLSAFIAKMDTLCNEYIAYMKERDSTSSPLYDPNANVLHHGMAFLLHIFHDDASEYNWLHTPTPAKVHFDMASRIFHMMETVSTVERLKFGFIDAWFQLPPPAYTPPPTDDPPPLVSPPRPVRYVRRDPE